MELHSSGIKITKCHLSWGWQTDLGGVMHSCDSFPKLETKGHFLSNDSCKVARGIYSNCWTSRVFKYSVQQTLHNTTWTNTAMWKVYGRAMWPWTVHPLFPIQPKWMRSTMWIQREMWAAIWVRLQRKMCVQKKQLSESFDIQHTAACLSLRWPQLPRRGSDFEHEEVWCWLTKREKKMFFRATPLRGKTTHWRVSADDRQLRDRKKGSVWGGAGLSLVLL